MKNEMGQDRTVTFNVTLNGLRPIVFDRYAGNAVNLTPAQKLYFNPANKEMRICLPTENLFSFLTATNTTSSPKRLLDKREYKDVCSAFQSFVDIDPPEFIEFERHGKPIVFGEFVDNKDAKSGAYVQYTVARLDKGIPNPKIRPVLPTPWELRFKITLFKNPSVNSTMLHRVLVDGGITVGLGTYRGRYGKFEVAEWKEVKK